MKIKYIVIPVSAILCIAGVVLFTRSFFENKDIIKLMSMILGFVLGNIHYHWWKIWEE